MCFTHLGRLERNAKENYRLETLLDKRCKERLELVHSPSALPGHGGEGHLCIVIISDED